MKILISLSSKEKELTLASLEEAVKKYFKKFKYPDSDHWTILHDCVLLCEGFGGRTSTQHSYKLMQQIYEKVKDTSASGLVPELNKVPPEYVKYGNEAFKALKKIVAETKLNGGSIEQWEQAKDLALVCRKLHDNVSPIYDLEEHRGTVHILRKAGIKVQF